MKSKWGGEREERDVGDAWPYFIAHEAVSSFVYFHLLRPSKQEPSSTMRLIHAHVLVTQQRGGERRVAAGLEEEEEREELTKDVTLWMSPPTAIQPFS